MDQQQQASTESSEELMHISFQHALRTISPLLECREVSLWKHPRQRRLLAATRKRRCVLLVRPCVLLFYKTAESQEPTTIIRLEGGSINTIVDHPRYLELQTRAADHQEEPRIWRLKFADETTVQLWRDALLGLQQQQQETLLLNNTNTLSLVAPPVDEVFAATISRTSIATSSSQATSSRQYGDNMNYGLTMTIMVLLSSLLLLLPVNMSIMREYYNQVPSVKPPKTTHRFLHRQEPTPSIPSNTRTSIIREDKYLDSGILSPMSITEAATKKNLSRASPSTTVVDSDAIFGAATTSTSVWMVVDTFTNWIEEMTRSASTPSNETKPPQFQRTYLRIFTSSLNESFAPQTGAFPPGSLVHDYFWSVLFATSLLATSLLSILSQLVSFPRGSQYWVGAGVMLTMSVLLGYDATINYWWQDPHHCLYWRGHAQSALAVICLGVNRICVLKAQRRVRHTISMARKATAGISALLASLSVPLALHSMQLWQQPGNAVDAYGFAFGMMVAFLALFTGMHFFGWARNDLIVGKLLYQISLVPTNIASQLLWTLGDVIHFLARQIYFFLRNVVWERVCVSFARSALWLCDEAQQIFQHVLLERWLCPCLHMVKRCCLAPMVRWIETALYGIVSLLEKIFQLCHRCLVVVLNVISATTAKVINCVVSACRFAYRTVLLPTFRMLYHLMLALANTAQRLFLLVVDLSHSLQTMLTRALLFLHEHASRCISKLLQLGRCYWRDYLVPSVEYIVQAISTVIWKLGNWTILHIFQPLGRATRRCVRTIARVLFRCLSTIIQLMSAFYDAFVERALIQHILPCLRDCCIRLFRAISPIVAGFLQKYWLLIPVGLVFNGAYLFAQAGFLTSNISAAARVQYAAGSWALFLVGCTIIHTVISSRGSLVQQHVVVEASILRYLDLRFFSSFTRICVSGWHALSTLLSLVLNAFDFLIRKSFKRLWSMLGVIYEHLIKPLAEFSRSVLRSIWDSPYWSMFVSLSALALVYMHHTELIAFDGILRLGASIGTIFQSVSTMARASCLVLYDGLPSIPNWFVADIYTSIYAPVLHVDVSSPAAAFYCWMITFLLTKTRTRVRIKTFGVPVIALYVTDVALLASCVTLICCWVLLSLAVDRYEGNARRFTMEAFSAFRSSRRPMSRDSRRPPVSNEQPVRFNYEQTECVICLDEFHTHQRNTLATLPCGHTFHACCVNEWMSHHQRCPVCRRAVGGWDRALEIAF